MKTRLILIRNYFGLSTSDFADECGLIRNSVERIINGRSIMDLETVQKICIRWPEISVRWFLFGEGEMIKKEKEA